MPSGVCSVILNGRPDSEASSYCQRRVTAWLLSAVPSSAMRILLTAIKGRPAVSLSATVVPASVLTVRITLPARSVR
ncbi:hypothetical protein D3C80_1127690 [compost metagenome]